MLIKQSKQFHLDAQVTQNGEQRSLSLSQLWPEAQKPHWRRILQLNLTSNELSRLGAFLTSAAASAVPDTPELSPFSAAALAGLAKVLERPEIYGVGATTYEKETLRLACKEKIRREGVGALRGEGFVVNFIGNIWAPWAEHLVTFWEEGLGTGWNLWINGEGSAHLLRRVLDGAGREFIFAPFPIPARLPFHRCEIHTDYAFCTYDKSAPPLTADERAIWEAAATESYGAETLAYWPINWKGDDHGQA